MYGMEHLHMHPAAQKRMDEEVAAHRATLDAMDPHDRAAVAAEVDRHLDRVHAILRDLQDGRITT